VGITQFEIDLFGRVMSLDKAALERYFAEEENQRSARLALVAEVANAWLALAADREQLRLAKATLATREDEFRLSARRKELGAISALDHAQVRTLVEAARADAARYEGQVAADRNALALLVGGPFDPALLPEGWEGTVTRWKGVPAGLTSELLLRRPDIRAAEHSLLAANANIGAARAAFFPSITLTGSAGYASDQLSSLFDTGTYTWVFVPQVNVPIFQGGRLRANLAVATADRDIALAQYEGAIQAAFRDVADALALTATLDAQRSARAATVAAAIEADRLSRARFEAGLDSYLVLLESQRTLYLAQEALILTQLAEQANRVLLYKALGGGWQAGGP
jgi:multidrug efflux system outer membrane protein